MKKITLAILTLLTAAACNIKSAKTTPESVAAFKTSSAGQWVSSCTQLLDVTNLGNSSQIFVSLNSDNTAAVRVVTYSNSKNCQTAALNGVKNLITDEYKFEYLVTETIFADQGKLKLTSVDTTVTTPTTTTTAPQTVLNVEIKTTGIDDAKEADVKLISGNIVYNGASVQIPDALIKKAQLKFKKSVL